MYHTLLLDLDDTIFDFKSGQRLALQRLFADYGVTLNDTLYQDYAQYNHQLWQQLEQGTITKSALLNNRFKHYLSKFDIHVDGRETDDRFRHYLTDATTLLPGARDVLDWLHNETPLQVYAASNGVYDTQLKRLTLTGILHQFDGIFISEKLGAEKPNPLFFERAFEQIPAHDISKTLMVGDSLSSDIQGANNIGMDCVWVNASALNKPDIMTIQYIITSIDELKRILIKQLKL